MSFVLGSICSLIFLVGLFLAFLAGAAGMKKTMEDEQEEKKKNGDS
jgi:hypothetical protein